MATLSTTKSYADGDVLLKTDLDAFLDDIETFLNTTKVNDDNIQDSGITASSKFKDTTITAAKINASAVTTAKLASSAIETAHILNSNVTTAKIADDAVTTAKIAADAITTAKIASTSMSNLSTLPYLISDASNQTVTATSLTAVTDLSITGAASGRPIWFGLIPGGDAGGSYLKLSSAAAPTLSVTLELLRDATRVALSTHAIYGNASIGPYEFRIPVNMLQHIDIPSAGTYTYSVKAATDSGVTLEIVDAKLVAVEL